MPLNAAGLRSWYEEYAAIDSESFRITCEAVKVVDGGELDSGHTERQVQQAMLTSNVRHGFCEPCRHLLDHWPNPTVQAVVGRHVNTLEIQAAAENGCAFCAYLLWTLIRQGLLDTFRKIESRLRLCQLDKFPTASLSIQNEGVSHQMLWLNFPGKVQKESPMFFYSDIVYPTGKLEHPHIFFGPV